ncbi:MAG: hypothetical protein GY943_21655, partial [Chloroflexi bacterium]|nr:hypothetical protein [Chloroflexota bacterium]
IDVAPLWQSQYAELAKHGPQQHLNEIISEYAYPDTPLIATDYINFDEHARKFLNKGSAIALAHMDISIPYIDHEWVEAMRSVPLADRVNYNIQIDLMKRLSPSLLKIPYQKTMLPLTAGKFRVKVHKKMRLYRRGIRKKLSRKPHKTQPPAYDYAGWSRVEMRQAIENLICHPNAVYRSYLREDKVAPLLARHFAGKEDWEHLISALVVLEVVHRLWIDPQSNDN